MSVVVKKGGRAPRPQLSKQEQTVLRQVMNQKTRFANLPPKALNIDMAYQDRPRQKMIETIAANYSSVLAGTLMVAERPDGSLWVCDGATRKLALETMGLGDQPTRCEIVKVDGQKQEALLFKWYNSARKAVPLANRINAEGIGGVNPVRKLVLETGFTLVGSGKQTLKGVSFLEDAYDLDGDGTALRKALFLLKRTWSEKHRLDGNTVLGIAILYHTQPNSVDASLTRLLNRFTPEKLDEKITRMWGGGKKMGARLRPNHRPRFVAKVLGLEVNKHPGHSGRVNIDRLDALEMEELEAA